MAITARSASFIQLHQKKPHSLFRLHSPNFVPFSRKSSFNPPMATLAVASSTLGLSETFSKLKQEGKVALIPYITAGDPDLSTTAEALKLLDSCGSDIIELGVPYSDPLADGPVIQAAAARALARGTNLNAIIEMLNKVVPQLSCPIALFTYYNPILKRGVEKFMIMVKEVGIHGLVVPDVPLEETGILRREASKHKIELAMFSEIVGSPYYMAREVLKRNHGPEVDIWRAGVILYILLCGVPLFWQKLNNVSLWQF